MENIVLDNNFEALREFLTEEEYENFTFVKSLPQYQFGCEPDGALLHLGWASGYGSSFYYINGLFMHEGGTLYRDDEGRLCLWNSNTLAYEYESDMSFVLTTLSDYKANRVPAWVKELEAQPELVKTWFSEMIEMEEAELNG